MEKIMTADKSTTFKNKQVDECYHSVSGAKEESVKKFIEPCLGTVKGKSEIWVLDVCFGLGYNTAAILDNVKNKNINVIALENDPEILFKVLEVEDVFENYNIIKELIKDNIDIIEEIKNNKESKNSDKDKNKRVIKINKDNITIKLFIDDARNSIKNIEERFDMCFLDPFSPKKCPELWSYGFLKDINGKMKDRGTLTTYSCARAVRENLKKAGFTVRDGPCVGRKAPATVAVREAGRP